MSYTSNCPVCDAEVSSVDDDPVVGELFDCEDCGVEIEIMNLDPFVLAEAPEECEDWGE